MVRWKCKDWLLYIDLEGTKEYYKTFKQNLEVGQEQILENYKKYCERLSEVECRFFDSLGIVPECCNVSSLGINKKGTLSVWGTYKIKGTYGHIMKEVAIPVEDFIEQKLYLSQNQSNFHNGLHIGSYGITFLYPDSEFNPCPENLDEGWIIFEFWIEAMPWLLEEPCTLKEYEPPRWWQFKKRYDEYMEFKHLQAYLRKECIDSVELYFQEQGIRFVRVEEKKIEPLQMYWLKRFTPKGQKKRANEVCISSNGMQNFLWHLFSHKIVLAQDGVDADISFTKICANSHESEQKSVALTSKAWVFLQVGNIGWKIDDASRINPSNLRTNMKDFYADFYITASDFSWTYAHTHEEECGPYFYCNDRLHLADRNL